MSTPTQKANSRFRTSCYHYVEHFHPEIFDKLKAESRQFFRLEDVHEAETEKEKFANLFGIDLNIKQ